MEDKIKYSEEELIAIPVEEYEHLKHCKKVLIEMLEIQVGNLQNSIHLQHAMQVSQMQPLQNSMSNQLNTIFNKFISKKYETK